MRKTKPGAKDETIYTISKRANVSPATVSRVINNYPHVGKETRVKVLKILSEYKYFPNNAARSLATRNSKMVGILIADLRTTHHTEGVYFMEQEFAQHGYSCLIYNTGTNPEKQAEYIGIVGQKQVDAVILMGSIYQNSTVLDAIITEIPDIPVALCNGTLYGPNIYCVSSNEKQGVFSCMQILAAKGHRHFVFLVNHDTPSNRKKIEGFQEGFQAYVSGGSMSIVETGDTIEDQERNLRKVLVTDPSIDTLFFAEDFMALVGLHVLNELQKKVPEEIAVVGINNSRYSQISNPALSSLDNMLYDTSIIAARNIIEVLKGNHVNKDILISTKFIERKTT